MVNEIPLDDGMWVGAEAVLGDCHFEGGRGYMPAETTKKLVRLRTV